MKNNIIQLSEDKVTIIDNAPQSVGASVEILIKFPQGAVMDALTLKGKVSRCEKMKATAEKNYLLELDISDLEPPIKLILQFYIVYLEREKLVDQIHQSLDFNSIFKDILDGKDTCLEDEAKKEFFWAKLNNITFH